MGYGRSGCGDHSALYVRVLSGASHNGPQTKKGDRIAVAFSVRIGTSSVQIADQSRGRCAVRAADVDLVAVFRQQFACQKLLSEMRGQG